MDLNSPDTWRWIWLVTAVALGFAETVTPVAFVFLPLALGAALAAVLAFAGVALPIEWLAFVLGSGIAYAVLLPVGKRMARGHGLPTSVGAQRWVGRQAHVLQTIPPRGTGVVRLDREEWRAESGTDVAIPAGSTVLVTRLDGTRLEVVPLELAPPESEGS
jgi:membrane protein implicated in regulation of membrane protease activity